MAAKVMVVTGASSGVGREMAAYFSSQGYHICALARDKAALEEVKRVRPDMIDVYSCDVSDRKSVEKTFTRITNAFKRIDVLVNNAAVFEMKDFVSQTIETIDRLIDTNLKGLMYSTYFALPVMIENGGGFVINIASVSGIHGIPKQSIYSASKHGVVGFSDALAQEVLDKGVKVVALCPGGIKTRLWQTEENPYPGDIDRIMDPQELVDLTDFVLRQPGHTLYKRIVFFPTNEWH